MVDLTRAALVVIDVQNGFIKHASKPVVPVIVDLVERWMAADLPVVFTRYHNYPGSPFERLIGWSQVQSSPQVDLVDELAPYTDRAILLDKKIYTLFTDEGRALVGEQGWTD